MVRLLSLREIGGIYLDVDTLTVKPFDDLLRFPMVMGVQASYYGTPPSLCNATIVASCGSPFVKAWIRRYMTFRSRGRDRYWDYHSTKIPALLSFYHPDMIKVVPFDYFFFPLWVDLPRVMLLPGSQKWLPYLTNSYSFHLWSGMTAAHLLKLDEAYVQSENSAYAVLAAPALRASL